MVAAFQSPKKVWEVGGGNKRQSFYAGVTYEPRFARDSQQRTNFILEPY
jgi:hypothetical protein